MPTCRRCGSPFPNWAVIEGKRKQLCTRKYCLICSPWGQHNTKILVDDPVLRELRERRASQVVSWRRRLKLKAVEYKGGSCEVCGYHKSPWALCFHHRDPTQKDFNIAGQVVSWERAKTELDKCIMLCLNCHAEEHARLGLRL